MCDCGKSTCILKDLSTYKIYEDRQVFEHAVIAAGEQYTTSRNTTTEVLNVNYKFNIWGSKCSIVKQMLRLTLTNIQTINANNINVGQILESGTRTDKAIEDLLKMKQLYKKLLSTAGKAKQHIQVIKTENKELLHRVKILKSEAKRLRYIVLSDIDEEVEELIGKPAIEQPTTEQGTTAVENEAPGEEAKTTNEAHNEESKEKDPLLKLQRIREYLKNNQLTLAGLCRINCVPMDVKRTIYNKYIDLKYDRNKVAHPKVKEPIQSDEELFRLLIDWC
jgi:hypothetical protein